MEIKGRGATGFRHDPELIEEYGIALSYGAKDAYEIDAPVIDTDKSSA